MANRPANAGAHSAGPQRRPASPASPASSARPASPASSARPAGPASSARPAGSAAQVLAWLPYLIVLAGVAVGVFVAWQGSRHAGRGAAVVGGALLAAAAARLVLPPRYAGPLVTRGKALDVAAFAVLGAAVLGVAAWLP
jgi:hypothetical protein